MMSRYGYIKLHRQVQDHWIYDIKPYDKLHAWIDLLLLANYEQNKTMYKGELQITNPGQIQTSLKALAEKWGWSVNKVKKFLNVLESDGMLIQKRTSKGTTLTVENWGKFQGRGIAEGIAESTSQGISEGTSEGIHKRKYKNIKNPQEQGVGDLMDELFQDAIRFNQEWKEEAAKNDTK